jgi:hypothetical protein
MIVIYYYPDVFFLWPFIFFLKISPDDVGRSRMRGDSETCQEATVII